MQFEYDGKEAITIRQDFPEDVLNELREEYISNVLKADQIQEEIKALNASKKAVLDENKLLLNRVVAGHESITIEAVYENDFDANMRYYYDASTGAKVHERRLKPSENQPSFLKAINS